MSGMLILVRHGQSEWNLRNLFTGWRNPDLTELGMEEARLCGADLNAAGLIPDYCFTSGLKRAQHTLDLILEACGIVDVTITRNRALNERDYGDLSGLDKDEARKKWGEEQVLIWRRSYDVPPPGGESLKDTAARTLPYYRATIEPMVVAGKTVLVAAHGNSLRALVMAIENLSPAEILKREIATGQPTIYRLGDDGSLAEIVAIGQTVRAQSVDASGPEGKGGPLRTPDAQPQ
ncbi:MAG: phosphoglyceromutase [Devosia sp.]|nr:phosphoglyceromutase [Devosia sp.]